MSNDLRGGQRKAVNLLVALRHPDLSSFEESFATNLSEGGMFIRVREPRPLGTQLRFEVQIAGGLRVMSGLAEVRWVRQPDDPSGPPGMGLQFVELDGATDELVRRMLAKKPGSAAAAAAARLERELRAQGLQPVVDPAASSPAAAAAAPPRSLTAIPFPTPVDVPMEVPPPPEDAVEIDLSELLAGIEATPAPDEDDGGVDIDLEMEQSPAAAAPPAPAPAPASVPVLARGGAPRPPAPSAPPPAARAPAPAPTPIDPEFDIEVDVPPDAPAAAAGIVPVHLKPKGDPPRTGPIIGIDLGTTNSCVAILENGKPKIVPTRSGMPTLPSVIGISKNGSLLVGQRAKDQLVLNPLRTIYGAKRLVGRAFDSPTVSEVTSRFHFPVCADGRGMAAVRLGEDVLSLEEVQGLVLQECKEIAEVRLGEPVHRAVITVPAYYSEAQREAVRTAGHLAGLRVERILNEPTAAALGYGLNRGLRRTVLIYDLGGGTFDATLLRLDDNVFEVMATGGDIFLGGMDFDAAITNLLIERFEATEGIHFAGGDAAMSRVEEAAERAKVALSQQHQVDVHLPMLMMDGDKPRDLRVTLTRADIELVCEPLVTRTLDVVRDVLLDGKMRPREVYEVLLVGGQSRMPFIHRQLREMFDKAPHAGVNAGEAVALGAALFAGTVDKISSVVLIDVLPMTLGIGLPGGGFKRLIERNVPLPTQRSITLPTTRDDQRTMELSLFQGESPHVGGNEYLGTVRLDGLPSAPRGMVRVGLTVHIDAESVLHVEARELSTRRKVNATMATRYTADQIRARLGITREQEHAASASRALDLRERGSQLWGKLKKAIGRA